MTPQTQPLWRSTDKTRSVKSAAQFCWRTHWDIKVEFTASSLNGNRWADEAETGVFVVLVVIKRLIIDLKLLSYFQLFLIILSVLYTDFIIISATLKNRQN